MTDKPKFPPQLTFPQSRQRQGLPALVKSLVEAALRQQEALIWLEFVHPKHKICGLCGSRGIIDTRGSTTTSAGVECGVRRYCICPEGRALKATGGRLESG